MLLQDLWLPQCSAASDDSKFRPPNSLSYRTALLHSDLGYITVSAPIEPRGSIFQNEFLGGVLLIFDLPGVVIKTGFNELVPFLSVSILRK